MATNRLEKLRKRRTDPLIKAAAVREAYDSMSEGESIKYAVGSMQPIGREYTKNTYAEGDRVKAQLDNVLMRQRQRWNSTIRDRSRMTPT